MNECWNFFKYAKLDDLESINQLIVKNNKCGKKIFTLANSFGSVLSEEYLFNMIRPGISIYGGHFNNDILKKNISEGSVKSQHEPVLDNQVAGAYSLNNLTDMLMNNNYETYISNIKNNFTSNMSSSQVFDKLSEVTKACVKNFYNKSL